MNSRGFIRNETWYAHHDHVQLHCNLIVDIMRNYCDFIFFNEENPLRGHHRSMRYSSLSIENCAIVIRLRKKSDYKAHLTMWYMFEDLIYSINNSGLQWMGRAFSCYKPYCRHSLWVSLNHHVFPIYKPNDNNNCFTCWMLRIMYNLMVLFSTLFLSLFSFNQFQSSITSTPQ